MGDRKNKCASEQMLVAQPPHTFDALASPPSYVQVQWPEGSVPATITGGQSVVSHGAGKWGLTRHKPSEKD